MDRLVCEQCADLFEYEGIPGEQRGAPDDMGKHLPRCNELSMHMMDITFDKYWDTLCKYGVDKIDSKTLSKESYLMGATSTITWMNCPKR